VWSQKNIQIDAWWTAPKSFITEEANKNSFLPFKNTERWMKLIYDHAFQTSELRKKYKHSWKHPLQSSQQDEHL